MDLGRSSLSTRVVGETVLIDERVPGSRLALAIEPTYAAVSHARAQTRLFLEQAGVDRPLVDDVELVVAELLANAVESEPDAPAELDLLLDGGRAHVTISNHTDLDDPIDIPVRPAGDPLAEGGWGLTIVAAVVDGMWIHRRDSVLSVTCLLSG